MADWITVLRPVSGARLTKLWKDDGTIEGYENAKTFDAVAHPVGNFDELVTTLADQKYKPYECVIRGTYDTNPASRVTRDTESTRDQPHHWVMLDCDAFEPLNDPNQDPLAACLEFVDAHLPPEFQDRSFWWQLSSSAGHPTAGANLKAHLWFWLDAPSDSPTLRAWAKRLKKVDPSVMRQVQPHYTADPIYEGPIAQLLSAARGPRSGIFRGILGDSVPLDLGYRPAAGSEQEIDVDIEKLRSPVADYDIDRVRDEIMPLLDPDMPHDDWVMVGMALAHQGQGGSDWLELWDEWSAHGASYTEDVCAERWRSFDSDRTAGTGAVTLRYLLGLTKEDRKEAVKAEAVKEQQPGTGNADRVLASLASQLGRQDITQLGLDVEWVPKRFDRTLGRVAWDAQRAQFRVMTPDGALLLAARQHVNSVLTERGMIEFYDPQLLEEQAAVSPRGAAMTPAQREKWLPEIRAYPIKRLLDFAIAHRQFTTISATVDMFAKKGGMRLADGVLTLVYPHEPLREGPFDQERVDDYRAHFPQLDQLLDLIVAARFATDRKTAHLWMHADSNWGKSFLTGMLKRHGLVVETSVAEIEKVMAGGPAGFTLEALRRTWVLAVDEFKGVTREIKQLSTDLTFSPKNQARVTVPLFLKLFLSAEDVPSLISAETGADAQFANRFMRLRLTGDMTVRSAYVESRAAYVESIANWIGVELNRRVAAHRAAGPIGAANMADATLVRLHAEWPLSAAGVRSLEERIPEIAAAFRDDMLSQWGVGAARTPIERIAHANVFERDGILFLKHTHKALDEWIEACYARAEAGKVRYKKRQIAEQLGESGVVRERGVVVRAVRLGARPAAESSADDDFLN